ncbi:MAG: hypothetical protein AB7U07_07070 [Thermoleophilia bacterium]
MSGTPRCLLLIALFLLAPAAMATAMPLSDPQGDVPRRDVDLLGGEITLQNGALEARLKLDGSVRRGNVYSVRIHGRRGERWTMIGVRGRKHSTFIARDERTGEKRPAHGRLVNQLVVLRFSASRMGAGMGDFGFSVAARSPGRPVRLDVMPAGSAPAGGELIHYRG